MQIEIFFAMVLVLSLFPKLGSGAEKNFQYKVLGVIASSESRQGVALLKHVKSGRVSALKEGQEVSKNLEIKKVSRKTVYFKWNGSDYSMRVGDEAPTLSSQEKNIPSVAKDLRNIVGIERRGDVLMVSHSLKENLVGSGLNEILMQAAAVPHMEEGRMIGFKILEIEEGSIYEVAGLVDGDVITHINERPLNDAGVAIKTLQLLKDSSSASFGFIRNGQKQELRIQIN